MPLLPAKLPIWAYLAAGGAAFAAAKLGTGGLGGGAGGGTVDPSAGPSTPTAAPAAGGSGLWDAFGDQGAQFGPGGQLGSIGYSNGGSGGGYSLGDMLGGQPIAVTITDPFGDPVDWSAIPPTPMPAPAPTPAPAPAPAPAPTPTPTATLTTYLWASVRAGTYKTYRINWGKAVLDGSLTTGGFSAEVRKRVVTAPDGTGTITLMIILTGAHAGKILHAYAPGITISTRTR